MSSTRRNFFQNAAAFSAALFGLSDRLTAQAPPPSNERARHVHAEDTSPGPRVITPDVPDLPFELDGNVKVFRLTSEVVKRNYRGEYQRQKQEDPGDLSCGQSN